jgi:hypothetical protein
MFIIFIHCRRGLIAVSLSLKKMMMAPFREKDKNYDGILSFDDFAQVLVNIGSTLSHEDVLKISLKYRATKNHENSYLPDYESENTYSDSVRNFRNGALLGDFSLFYFFFFSSFSPPFVFSLLTSSFYLIFLYFFYFRDYTRYSQIRPHLQQLDGRIESKIRIRQKQKL